MSDLKGRIDFITLIEVKEANPNGDPSNGNRPRQTDSGLGEMSDVCIKRKIRNRLQDSGASIFVQSEDRATDGLTSLSKRFENNIDAKLRKDRNALFEAVNKQWLDVRCFGQVFAFKGETVSLGVRGAVTIQPAFSISEIETETTSIVKSVNSEETKDGKKASDTMGEKHRVKYGLYVLKGSVNARTAAKNGVSAEDVELLLDAIKTMFVNDDTSARPAGSMNIRDMYVFYHDNIDGQYSPLEVFNSLKIEALTDYPEKYEDYKIELESFEDLETKKL